MTVSIPVHFEKRFYQPFLSDGDWLAHSFLANGVLRLLIQQPDLGPVPQNHRWNCAHEPPFNGHVSFEDEMTASQDRLCILLVDRIYSGIGQVETAN